MKCNDCDAEVKIPSDVISGEIVSCKDCGLEWEVYIDHGQILLKKADKPKEDWGE